jgi:hypothetical protein
MEQIIANVWAVIVALVGAIMVGIGIVETALRDVMGNLGIAPQIQSVILLACAVLLILAAFRLFGGLLALLIGIFLFLLILHVAAPHLNLGALSRP